MTVRTVTLNLTLDSDLDDSGVADTIADLLFDYQGGLPLTLIGISLKDHPGVTVRWEVVT